MAGWPDCGLGHWECRTWVLMGSRILSGRSMVRRSQILVGGHRTGQGPRAGYHSVGTLCWLSSREYMPASRIHKLDKVLWDPLTIRTRLSKLCESQIFRLWVYLNNVHPLKISPLKNILPLNLVAPEKYSPLKKIHSRTIFSPNNA